MNSNIFNLQANYIALMNAIEEADGVLDEDLSELLKCTEENAMEHCEQLVSMKKSLESDCTIIDDEIARLTKLKGSKTNSINRVKESLLWLLNNFGESGKSGNKTIKLATNTVFTKSTPHCEILDEPGFDNRDFTKYIVSHKFSKDDIPKLESEFNLANGIDIKPNILKKELGDTLKISNLQLYIEEDGSVDPNHILNLQYSFNSLGDYIVGDKTMYKYSKDTNRYHPIARIEYNNSVQIR